MINGINNLSGSKLGVIGSLADGPSGASPTGGASFADTLKKSIGEVSKMQEDASKAIEDFSTGKSQNVTGVMTAVEKSDLAFKTLLAIRTKLMEAYDEIKNMPM